MFEHMLSNQLLILLAIILIGYALGSVNIRGISIGNSACLFVALAAGMLGAKISPIITEIGIVFFVYSIGLQAGPQFFRIFNRRGVKFAVLGLFTVLAGGLCAIIFARLIGITTGVAVGAFAGAMTSTPALASAIDTIEMYMPGTSGAASLSYAIAYPFGLISEILFVQIVPRLYRKKINHDREIEAKERERQDFKIRKYRLTNANIAGKAIENLDLHRICKVNLTRFKRNGEINLCMPDTVLELNDIVVAVGTDDELAKFKLLFGEEVDVEVPMQSGMEIKDIFISGSNVAGRPLRDLDLREIYGITVTRVYRGDVAIAPTGSLVLEAGDTIRVVGIRESIERFTKIAGSEKRKMDDTNILILALGMFAGVLLGMIPVKIGTFTLKLGAAGGPLFVALLLGHFGKIWKWPTRVPNATKFFLRDIGLVFFLIGVGVSTGSKLLSTAAQENLFNIFALGVIISLFAMFASFIMVYNIFKVPLASALGAMCGAKTSGASLMALIRAVEDESPAITYAAVYPVSIIILTIFGQILVFAGMAFLK
jgi:putative transport protein